MDSMTLYIREGSKKNLCCKVDSNPAPISTRLVNGSEALFVKHNVQNICYQFDKVNRYDQGNYTCIAENEIGSASTTISLKVKCKSFIDNRSRDCSTKVMCRFPQLLKVVVCKIGLVKYK